MSQKFKKNDQVIVISGSDKGKIGKILSVSGEKVIVEGINIAVVHKKPTSSDPGKILKIEKEIHKSNISHTDSVKAIKVKFFVESGDKKPYLTKTRLSKKSGKKIE